MGKRFFIFKIDIIIILARKPNKFKHIKTQSNSLVLTHWAESRILVILIAIINKILSQFITQLMRMINRHLAIELSYHRDVNHNVSY